MRTVIPAEGYALLLVFTKDKNFYYYRQPILAFTIDTEDEEPVPEPVTFTGDQLSSDYEQGIVAALVLPDERVIYGGDIYRSVSGFVSSLKTDHAKQAKLSAASVADLV